MDTRKNILVLGCANRHISTINLLNPSQQPTTIFSPLKFQTRVIKAFPDATGYCIGGIDGRIGVDFINNETRNYSFKCHRGNQKVNMVNDLCFNNMGTMCSVGSDGAISIWDINSKSSLRHFDKESESVLKCSFNPNGTLLAYACGFDYQDYNQCKPYNGFVKIQKIEPADIRPKNKR